MNSRRSLGFAAAILVTACATIDRAPKTIRSPQCTTPQCTYTVQVYSCDRKGIVPEYEEIHVAKGTHRIHWVITTPGATFTPNGIDFPGRPPEITDGLRVNPKEFSWTVTNSSPQGAPEKRFKYDIRVVDSSGATCLLDPSVVND